MPGWFSAEMCFSHQFVWWAYLHGK